MKLKDFVKHEDCDLFPEDSGWYVYTGGSGKGGRSYLRLRAWLRNLVLFLFGPCALIVLIILWLLKG